MRLNKENIALIKNFKTKPNYNASESKNTIIHFGVGNFHRAHQAFFIHEILNSNKDLSIIGINLRSEKTRKILKKQNYLYSLYECSEKEINVHILNPFKKLLFGQKDKKEICNLISDSFNKIITVTVTEKGYHYDTIKKRLDLNSDINNDLENKKLKTLIGHLSYGLIERYKKNKEEIYILSCDNLSSNGDILKTVIVDFVYRINKEAAIWIKDKVIFPSTMVDCIVPNTKNLPNTIKEEFEDQALVICEPYRDWYIQNKGDLLKNFLSHKQIKFVDNVKFYEKIKLKILNSSHSALAYMGLLLGYKYVHEVINNKHCYNFINNYLEKEVITTIQTEDNFDLYKYKENILKRFKNYFLNHKLEQIGMDGSLKMPIRIIDTFRNRKKDTKCSHTFLIIACWILFLKKENFQKNNYKVIDPMFENFTQIFNNEKNFVEKLIDIQSIFDVSLEDKFEIKEQVQFILTEIEKLGLDKLLVKFNG